LKIFITFPADFRKVSLSIYLKFFPVYLQECVGSLKSVTQQVRHFNVRRLLAFDARLASIHLLQFPRRLPQITPPYSTHPPLKIEKKNPRLFQISSTFGQLFMRFAFISFWFVSPRSGFCVLFICAFGCSNNL